MHESLNPYYICQAANKLIGENGFDQVDMASIAKEAGIREATLYTFFGSKQDIVLFLYQSVNVDWQLFVNDLAATKLADRFEQAMTAKVAMVQPYHGLLSQIMGLMLQQSKIGIQSPRTSHIRAIGAQTIHRIIAEAGDGKRLSQKLKQLPSLLYMLHWAILFFSIHTDDEAKTRETIMVAAKMLRQLNKVPRMLSLFPFFGDLGNWAGSFLNEPEQPHFSIDKELLKIIFNHRKTTEATPECLDNSCETCIKLQEAKIRYFTSQQQPIHFILPAFPAKSPNPEKVLGALPDLGEEIALKTLDDLCSQIQSVYPPGAQITICSDGRIFSELVGVSDEDVSRYVDGIKNLIAGSNLRHVNIVNLEDLMKGDSFDKLRETIISRFAEPIDSLHDKLRFNADFKSLFNGIHRFITEDRRAMEPQRSTSKIKAESAAIALKVIQHSNAWTRFLAYVYPDAIRLSIHPYPAHSDKIGIRLTKAIDDWLTPWHGVIVLQEDGYLLMKKHQSIAQGAKLVTKEGQPYYYTLIPDK